MAIEKTIRLIGHQEVPFLIALTWQRHIEISTFISRLLSLDPSIICR
jgi:hypothetical protein